MVKDSDTATGDTKKSAPTEMIETATNLVLAVARGSVVGVGKGLSVLGSELEKFGERIKTNER